MSSKKQIKEVPNEEQMIAYLKSQIAIFSRGQNKSERLEGYYKNELNKLENE